MADEGTSRVTRADAGLSVGQWVKRLLAADWRRVRELVQGRYVAVNGGLCIDDQRRLEAGDVVRLLGQPLPLPPGEREVRIVFVDEHLIVVEKPAGMMSLRRPEERSWPLEKRLQQPALEEVVARQVGPVKSRQDPSRSIRRRLVRVESVPAAKLPGEVRLFDVHRLDRDTSGLLMFARTPDVQRALIRLIQKHRVEREYLAIVHGAPAAQKLDTWLVRDRGDGLRGSLPAGVRVETAQRAITWVEPVGSVGPYTLVKCRLATGRTHQIRIHLSEIGHRVCGEPVYTNRLGETAVEDDCGAPRQALHAAALRFVHPVTGKAMEFTSDWPTDIREWIEACNRRGQDRVGQRGQAT